LHRLSNAEAYAPLSRVWQPKARIVYSIADLHHVRSARQAAVHGNAELAETASYMKARELNAMRMVDAVVTHSLAEADYIRREEPSAIVHVVPWALRAAPRKLPLRRRSGIAFVGGMRHAPNPDAVRWLAAEILPHVWARDPSIECQLVGADWPEPVWGRLDPRLRLTGPVERLDEVFDRVRLTVAPLRFGTGIKGKVLDSFAAGLPCVMTPIAAEGIPLGSVLRTAVAADPLDIADLICDLHNRPSLNGKHARAGLALIAATYTEAAIVAALDAAVSGGAPVAA